MKAKSEYVKLVNTSISRVNTRHLIVGKYAKSWRLKNMEVYSIKLVLQNDLETKHTEWIQDLVTRITNKNGYAFLFIVPLPVLLYNVAVINRDYYKGWGLTAARSSCTQRPQPANSELGLVKPCSWFHFFGTACGYRKSWQIFFWAYSIYPVQHFKMLEPRNPTIDKFHVVKKSRSKALTEKYSVGISGGTKGKICVSLELF